ncbi:multiple RNA-binding domain-containing protein 1-like [Phoenix dactylifera]|uniref:Multiple RNA-binding domain-containing protein 1-like n=1 Tax=Phoenix dactylifera TaxID=42345 RepID=A0A8B9AQR4_PHODC|nr:multiple RNA-binding domain-containing protein 1-like [Phoenix dactylifera]
MALRHLASPSVLSPLLCSRRPCVISAASPSFPLFPQTLTSNPPLISISSPGSRHHSNLQPVRCCTIPESSSTVENPSSSRIFVKGLSRTTSEGYLAKIFSCFGEVSRVKIVSSKTSKESLGLAYLWFAREQDARRAVKEMDGKFVDGRFIAVMMAKPESPSKQVRAIPYQF